MDDRELQINEPENEPENIKPPENNGQEENKTIQYELYDWAQAMVTALIVVVLMFALVVRVIGVEGKSMLPTLHEGDKVLLTKLFYTPKYGDIVVLTKNSFMEKPIVKRVIATEGQIIEIDLARNTVWIDGNPLEENYIFEPMRPFDNLSSNLYLDLSKPMTVPEGCIFVMGDNRNHSSDSRYATLGMVDTRYVLGRVLMRVYPFDAIGAVP